MKTLTGNIQKVPKKARGYHKLYECCCDCGNIWFVREENIKTTQNCAKCCIGNKHPSWKGYGEISANFWHRLLSHAKLRRIQVEITIQEAWDLFLKQNRKCIYTNIELQFGLGKNWKIQECTASLDRTNNNKGYFLENVQWVHKDVNLMKLDHSEEDFLKLIKVIYEYRKL